jgi:ABC-type phosphate/phosphonate transport system substrate-binding protein
MKCASLPMYDWPEVRDATAAWWAGLARALRAEGLTGVPGELISAAEPAALWGRDDLLLSQTCGYPLTHAWSGRLQVVATPAYAAEGCEATDYCSFVLVHRDSAFAAPADLAGGRAAFNAPDSQSGYSALRAVFADHARDGRFFSQFVETGGHANSMAAVADGRADVCAVDAIVWALARRHRAPLARRLRAIARSPSAPGLPYVTAPGTSAEGLGRLRAGLRAALADPSLAAARAELLIDDMIVLDLAAYDRVLEIEAYAVAKGYGELG